MSQLIEVPDSDDDNVFKLIQPYIIFILKNRKKKFINTVEHKLNVCIVS